MSLSGSFNYVQQLALLPNPDPPQLQYHSPIVPLLNVIPGKSILWIISIPLRVRSYQEYIYIYIYSWYEFLNLYIYIYIYIYLFLNLYIYIYIYIYNIMKMFITPLSVGMDSRLACFCLHGKKLCSRNTFYVGSCFPFVSAMRAETPKMLK